MVKIFALTTLAALQPGCRSARMALDVSELSGTAESLGTTRNVSAPCPPDVEKNKKGDCVDTLSGLVVEDECCAAFANCDKQGKEGIKELQARMGKYFSTCQVLQTDLVIQSDRTFTVLDGAKFCTEECQAVAEFTEGPQVDLEKLTEEGCSNHDSYEMLSRMMDAVRALDTAWHACRAPPSTTVTTTLKPELFDDVTADNVVFLIDRSQSMDALACTNGYKYNRFDFAAIELWNAVSKMSSKQRFNVILFDTEVYSFESEPVSATDAKKEEVLAFMGMHNPCEGFWNQFWGHCYGTNVEKGIKLAFGTRNVDVVHLLSDGEANEGAKKVSDILRRVGRTVPVHATLFMPGEDSSRRAEVASFLQDLAERTGGTFQEPFPALQATCPERVGLRATLSNCGMWQVNGRWEQEGSMNGKPRYVMKIEGFLPFTGEEYVIEWQYRLFSESGVGDPRWVLFSEGLVRATRLRLYESFEDTPVVATKGWKPIEGQLPAPTIVSHW